MIEYCFVLPMINVMRIILGALEKLGICYGIYERRFQP